MFIIIHSYSKTRDLYFLVFNHIYIFVTLFLCLSGIYYACVMSKLHRFTCHVTRKVSVTFISSSLPFVPLKGQTFVERREDWKKKGGGRSEDELRDEPAKESKTGKISSQFCFVLTALQIFCIN